MVGAADIPSAGLSPLKETATSLGLRFAGTLTDATTHPVCGDLPWELSVPCLRSLLAGAWLVTPDWTAACAEAGQTLPAEPWHVAGEAGSQDGRRKHLQLPLRTEPHV